MPADLDALRERLERAEGADDLLFQQCRHALLPGVDDWNGTTEQFIWIQRFAGYLEAKAYLDAAVALVQRVRPGCHWQVNDGGGAWVQSADPLDMIAATGATPAIAIVLGLVKRLIQEAEGAEPERDILDEADEAAMGSPSAEW